MRSRSGGDVGERVVERLDVHPGAFAEFREAQVRILDVAAHGEVGAVDLQHDAGFGDRLVFLAHRLGDREQIRLLARVVVVAEEQRDDAGRGRAHERFGPAHARPAPP